MSSKEELFAKADFITIHMVLSQRSRGLVGASELALMKPTAYLVNTSRGPIVDEAALLAACKRPDRRRRARRIRRRAAADRSSFPHIDNIVLTPHLGYVTEQNYAKYFANAVEDIRAWLDGRPVRVLAAK